jgi:hypothetical protein
MLSKQRHLVGPDGARPGAHRVVLQQAMRGQDVRDDLEPGPAELRGETGGGATAAVFQRIGVAGLRTATAGLVCRFGPSVVGDGSRAICPLHVRLHPGHGG